MECVLRELVVEIVGNCLYAIGDDVKEDDDREKGNGSGYIITLIFGDLSLPEGKE